MKTDLKQKILDATHNGLDIIQFYYPQAAECANSNKKFKIRDESTASASIKETTTGWIVTDFGGDGTGKSCFDIVMQQEKMTFTEALHFLAARYGVGDSINKEINKPAITTRKAKKTEKEGDFNYKAKVLTESELSIWGSVVTAESLNNYSYYSLEWYCRTKKNENNELVTTTISSTENFPIFLRICRHDDNTFHFKIYTPLNYDKSFRFFYVGTLPKGYINGLSELQKDCEILKKETNNENAKFSEVIICSGERDAMCCAGMGYKVLWLNSETAELSENDYYKILRYAETIYNVPDLDTTGINRAKHLALQYLDIKTVFLPERIKQFRDNRGKQRKDLRDYVELQSSKTILKDFSALLKQAKPCCFWQTIISKDAFRIEINTLYYLNFLKINGFYKIKETKDDFSFVKLDGNVVSYVTKDEIRDFSRKFLENRQIDQQVQNTFINSKRTTAIVVNDLDFIDLNFDDYTFDSQFLHLKNTSLQIFADKIIEFRDNSTNAFVLKDRIVPHDFKRLPPSFEINYINNIPSLQIKEHNSNVLRVMINSSRLHWKKEFEERIDAEEEFNFSYFNRYKYSVEGSRLTDAEINEQQKCLLNKIFAIGYIMHGYKQLSRAWALWLMENKITEENESNGGSGKSFFMQFIKIFKNTATVDVSRKESFDKNNHVLERITKNTQIALCEDCDRFIDFRAFFQNITEVITVNPKQRTSFDLPFSESPKFCFTSNYPPNRSDGSVLRRLLFVLYSDYYHEKGKDYRESRTIRDDFSIGCDLFSDRYTKEAWNADINFLIDCIQFYLSTLSNNTKKIDPPMKNILSRFDVSQMGDVFKEWADVFFNEEGENVNTFIGKDYAYNDFRTSTRSTFGTRKFKEALQAYCRYSDNIIAFNPAEYCQADGRIIKKMDGKTQEMLFIKTKEESKQQTEIEELCF